MVKFELKFFPFEFFQFVIINLAIFFKSKTNVVVFDGQFCLW